MKVARKATQTTAIQMSMYQTGLGVFLALRAPQNIGGRGQHDHQLPAPEHEPAEVAAPQPRRAGALHDVERAHDQRVAAKGEDHRAGVQRPQPAEVQDAVGPGSRFSCGKASCSAMTHAHQEAHDAPEGRRDHPGPDHAVIVLRAYVGKRRRLRRYCAAPTGMCRPPPASPRSHSPCRPGRAHNWRQSRRTASRQAKQQQFHIVPHLASLRLHADSPRAGGPAGRVRLIVLLRVFAPPRLDPCQSTVRTGLTCVNAAGRPVVQDNCDQPSEESASWPTRPYSQS